MGRGGKRPGAGRKLLADAPRVAISARVSQETKDILLELRSRGLSTGQVLDQAVADYVSRNRENDIYR